MRYFSFVFGATVDQIEKNAKIKLRDYCYDNTINALNVYMYRNMRNDETFYVYREENGTMLASFSYNEKKESMEDIYSFILEELDNTFLIKKVKTDPHEITMYQFLDNLVEGKRRDFIMPTRIVENAHLWIYDYFYVRDPHTLRYEFKEKIISESDGKNPLYNQRFKDELTNIETHKNDSGYQGNLVHYVISAGSMEAASDMTESLMWKLLESNRISGRRMEIISEIDPLIYRGTSRLEDMIENNNGGVIVFDLTEKFGGNPSDYLKASEYLLTLLKTYRNKCLFVFVYNKNNPGFSYHLLPHISKYVTPVMLSEGKGDRKAAVKYMKQLIRSSEYSKYAGQAGEFMKLFPGDDFTQTDVLMAYEQFESWCLNKNIMKAYDYDISEDFMLDRDENSGSSYEKLNSLIGLSQVKKQIEGVLASDIIEKERRKRMGKGYESSAMHMVFAGDPGTAKTTVAKLFAGAAKEKGVLKSGAFVEKGGMDLNGWGCVYLIREAFVAAKGGVLFIDEAYSLTSDVAITTLIQEMENRRDEVIVILAGYSERMRQFMELNEGLKSRIPHWIDFPNYNADELTDIFKYMLSERGFTAEEDAIKAAHHVFERVCNLYNFGNGRYVRNLLGKAAENQSARLAASGKPAEKLQKKELFLIKEEDITQLDEGLREEREPGTAKKELEAMIGLSSAKELINKAIAKNKLNKICSEKGITKEKVSLHMVFTGNPGTAKTSVARLFAEIMKDEKVLSSGTFVEVGRADLVGPFVGSTAPLVKRRFKEAQGGVLFIDEAYSLCDDRENSYGDEAINTIVQEMENHRDDTIVIFAGYPEPMQQFLDRNPGMHSRIAFHVNFEDYTTDELCEITNLMITNKHMSITDAAMEKLRHGYDMVRWQEDYGNGRFVRKVIEEAEMNLAERLIELDESELTEEMVTTIDECDIPDIDPKEKTTKMKMGFCVDSLNNN